MFGLDDSDVDLAKLKASITAHEGDRREIYDDANGKPIVKGYTVVGNPTIGIGRLATAGHGLSPKERLYLLDNDVAECLAIASVQSWYALARDCEPRLRAIVEIIFQLGLYKFDSFVDGVSALNRGDWAAAAAAFLDSLWRRQAGNRAETLCAMILTGSDQA